jgi:arginyl-tRNA synthetase
MSASIVHEKVTAALAGALEQAKEQGTLTSFPFPQLSVDLPKREEWGDLSSSIAMMIAKKEARPPKEIADLLAGYLNEHPTVVEHTSVAPPGFLNFTVARSLWFSLLQEIDEKGPDYGKSHIGEGRRILLEYVSANPTGPLHMGHGRGAALGDALARVLEAVGFVVEREFYVNDAGRQMKLLGASVFARYQECLGVATAFPDDGYHGKYIRSVAQGIVDRHGKAFLDLPIQEAQDQCGQWAHQELLSLIQQDLKLFGVEFDSWFSEASLFAAGKVQESLTALKKNDLVFEQDEAVWFRSSRFQDEKDRVVIKQDGAFTYLASDIAYHHHKLTRGFDQLLNIWGADHHGYIPRMKGAVQAFGYSSDVLQVVLVQMVSLLRDGKKVEMSKRAGEFVTLREVIEEVGADAARFFFLMRRPDSHLEFDLELAKKQSSDNPVYYVQYAHARLSSLFRVASERGYVIPSVSEADLTVIVEPEEFRLIKHLSTFPGLVMACARAFEPHRLTFYLQELAGHLHAFYFKHRVLPPRDGGSGDRGLSASGQGEETETPGGSPSRAVTIARLVLLRQVQTVLRNGLGFLGVSAPESM